MFKWTALSLATLFLLTLLLLLNDLRLQLKRTALTVNEKLPQILEKTEKSTATPPPNEPGQKDPPLPPHPSPQPSPIRWTGAEPNELIWQPRWSGNLFPPPA